MDDNRRPSMPLWLELWCMMEFDEVPSWVPGWSSSEEESSAEE